ncbi:hypothetical protein K458DRAFT_199577 [Lentithecium fluviatile CBS 122367]|uniref:DC-UbP/UBTD2 N-terminal domain-containing protein n=1 Tax=Lentithecium fluviatile CBS 122367 TaxID=1168545 RepID=A0A6G1J8V0_9PLEO|nr:hypothetical protein K458DRAFT_199577 [Lentithecium fluviatile CBS 122367]
MGCCSSREAGDDASPYPPVSSTEGAPDASSRHIATASPTRNSSVASPRASHSHSHTTHPTPEARPNVPLKPIDPSHRSKLPSTLGSSPTDGSHHTHVHVAPLSDSTHALWTRRRLDKEREDWWDTRTTGEAAIWSAMRLMVQSLQEGDVGEAQALLDAMECTCPNGCLWKGVFDRRGEWYRVPEWIVVEPEGLVEEGSLESMGSGGGKGKEVVIDREEDGEGELGERVKVRCRLSADGRDVVVGIRKGERVGSLIANLKAKAKINPFASVRIVYGGKIFEENQALDSHPYWSYDGKHVLVAMVFE